MASGLTNSTGVVNRHAPVYTIAKDRTNSDPSTRVSYLDDLADFSIQEVETLYKEHNRPCVYDRTGDGGVAYHLKWDNWDQKLDGTASDLSGADGDVCIEMDRVWWKAWTDGNRDMFSWTYEYNPDLKGFKPWAHYKGADKTVPHIYPGVFKFAENNSYLGSYVDETAKPARSQNMTSFEANCKNLVGTNNKAEYTLARMPTYTLIREMHDAVSKSTDSQSYFGKGITSKSGSEANLIANSDGFNPTSMMRYTPTTDGLRGVDSIGFNNMWGHVYEFCGQTAYANRHFKCNYLNDAASYVAAIASASYATLPSVWYETQTPALPFPASVGWQYPNGDLNEGPCAAMAATTTSGSGTSTYYCDGTYMPVSGATNNCVRFGGLLDNGALAGLRCARLNIALSSPYWDNGARLLIIPPV